MKHSGPPSFAPPQLPSLRLPHWFQGHLSSIFVHIYLDRDSYADHLRGSHIKKLNFAVYVIFKLFYAQIQIYVQSHSLEGWYSQLCTRNVMLILTAAAMSWVVRGDPLHQAASQVSASLLGLPHSSGWYPASLSMRNKTFNNLNFNLNYLPVTLHLPVSC